MRPAAWPAGQLLLCLLTVPCLAGAVTYIASTPEQFLNALANPNVDKVEVRGVVDFSHLPRQEVGIGSNRSVEVYGALEVFPGANGTGTLQKRFSSGINFGSLPPVISCGVGSNLTFRNLVLWNSLSLLGYDFIVVRPVASVTLRFESVVKVRRGGLPLSIFLQHMNSFPRIGDGTTTTTIATSGGTSGLLGGAGQEAQQSVVIGPFCYWPPGSSPGSAPNCTQVLAVNDLATTVSRVNGQSYSLYERDSAYYCTSYVSMTCLSAAGPETCVQLLDRELTGNSTAAPPAAGAEEDDPGPPLNVILPTTIVGGLALLAACALAVWYARRRSGRTCCGGGPWHDDSSDGGKLPRDDEEGGDDVEAGPPGCGSGAGEGEGGKPGPSGARERNSPQLTPAGSKAGVKVGGSRGSVGSGKGSTGKGRSSKGAAVGGGGGSGGQAVEGGAGAAEAGQQQPQQAGGARAPGPAGHHPRPLNVSEDALKRIAQVREELSSKMVVASSADDLSDVRALQMVGKGTFGRVYKGEWRGATVALKVISVPVSQCGQAQWQQVLGEAAIATLLNHPSVLQTFSVALLEYVPKTAAPGSVGEPQPGVPAIIHRAPAADDAPSLPLGEPLYQLKLVSEFCECGSLVSGLHKMNFFCNFPGSEAARLPVVLDLASQIASGMAYLHSANIVHCDLKAQNVLLKSQPGSGRLQAKVADFGLSFRMEDAEDTHATKGHLGSLSHMAPEVLVKGHVSKSSDVYAFGILLYELYTGGAAYTGTPAHMLAYHVATAGGRPVMPPHCPAPYRQLAEDCWAQEPAKRPKFKQAFERLQAFLLDVLKGMAAQQQQQQQQQRPTSTAAAAAAPAAGALANAAANGPAAALAPAAAPPALESAVLAAGDSALQVLTHSALSGGRAGLVPRPSAQAHGSAPGVDQDQCASYGLLGASAVNCSVPLAPVSAPAASRTVGGSSPAPGAAADGAAREGAAGAAVGGAAGAAGASLAAADDALNCTAVRIDVGQLSCLLDPRDAVDDWAVGSTRPPGGGKTPSTESDGSFVAGTLDRLLPMRGLSKAHGDAAAGAAAGGPGAAAGTPPDAAGAAVAGAGEGRGSGGQAWPHAQAVQDDLASGGSSALGPAATATRCAVSASSAGGGALSTAEASELGGMGGAASPVDAAAASVVAVVMGASASGGTTGTGGTGGASRGSGGSAAAAAAAVMAVAMEASAPGGGGAAAPGGSAEIHGAAQQREGLVSPERRGVGPVAAQLSRIARASK